MNAQEYACARVKDLVGLYAGDDLDPDEAARVAAHLEHCEACRGEAAAYGRMRDELRLLASERMPDRLPPFFWQGIQKEILLGGERRGRSSPLARRVLYGIAAAVLLALTAFLAASLSGGGPETVAPSPLVVNAVAVEDNDVVLPDALVDEGNIVPAGAPDRRKEIRF